MEDVVNARARALTGTEVRDVGLDEREVFPGIQTDTVSNVEEVLLFAGGEVIKADDLLVKFEQRFDEIGADEARRARDEPRARLVFQLSKNLFVLHNYLTPKGARGLPGSGSELEPTGFEPDSALCKFRRPPLTHLPDKVGSGSVVVRMRSMICR